MANVARIVIVEDDFLIAEANRLACEDIGLDVVATAHDAEEAVGAILGHAPDLVLLDVRLGDQDGVAVMDEVRGAGFAGRIIFATGSSDADTLARLTARAPQGILIKPFADAELAQAVTAALAAPATAPTREPPAVRRPCEVPERTVDPDTPALPPQSSGGREAETGRSLR